MYVLLIMALILVCNAYGQEVTISASVDKNPVDINDRLILTVVVSGTVTNVPEPIVPKLDGFDVAGNPGTSSSFTIINGRVSASITKQYVLIPSRTGKITISQIKINYKGQTIEASPITVEVTKGVTSKQKKTAESVVKGNFYLGAYVDKNKVVVGEKIVLTFSFYWRGYIYGNRVSLPQIKGFWIDDLTSPGRGEQRNINGVFYMVQDIKKAICPISAGVYTIEHGSWEVQSDPFNPASVYRSVPIRIEVSKLPAKGKPDNFNGCVGAGMTMYSKIDKKKIYEDEAVVFKVKISGECNPKLISQPKFPDEMDFEKREVGDTVVSARDSTRITGEKTFEYVLIPKSSGKCFLKPVTFSYYDYIDKKYRTLRTEQIAVEVREGSSGKGISVPPAGGEYREIYKDIRYIKTKPLTLSFKSKPLYEKRIFLLVNLLSILVLVLSVFMRIRNRKYETDVKYARTVRAKRIAVRRLKKARNIMGAHRTKEFYAEISKSLYQYIADKFNCSGAGMTIEMMDRCLNGAGMGGDIFAELKKIIDKCDMVRFAPVDDVSAEEMERVYDEAVELITNLEEKLYRNPK